MKHRPSSQGACTPHAEVRSKTKRTSHTSLNFVNRQACPCTSFIQQLPAHIPATVRQRSHTPHFVCRTYRQSGTATRSQSALEEGSTARLQKYSSRHLPVTVRSCHAPARLRLVLVAAAPEPAASCARNPDRPQPTPTLKRRRPSQAPTLLRWPPPRRR